MFCLKCISELMICTLICFVWPILQKTLFHNPWNYWFCISHLSFLWNDKICCSKHSDICLVKILIVHAMIFSIQCRSPLLCSFCFRGFQLKFACFWGLDFNLLIFVDELKPYQIQLCVTFIDVNFPNELNTDYIQVAVTLCCTHSLVMGWIAINS